MPETLSITVTRNGQAYTVNAPAKEVVLWDHVDSKDEVPERNPDGSRPDRDEWFAERIAKKAAALLFNYDAADPIPDFGGKRHDRMAAALGMEPNSDELKKTAPGQVQVDWEALPVAERNDFRSVAEREADAAEAEEE